MRDSLIRDYHAEVDGTVREGWSRCLGLFDDATIMHAWDFAEAICPGQRVSRLLLKRRNDVAGMAQVRIVKAPLVPLGIAYVSWGPLWRRKGALADLHDFQAVLAALRREYAEKRRLLLRISPNIAAGEEAGLEDVLEQEGFERNPNVPAYRTILLDIRRPLEEIRRGFSRKWRQSLGKVDENPLSVRQGTSPGFYEEFLPIYGELLARKKLESIFDIPRWAMLQRILPEEEKPTVFLACREGNPVAGLILSPMGGTGFPIFYAANDAGRKFLGTHQLIWHAISWLQERGCRQFDLGGIDPETDPDIYRFKKGSNGKEVSFCGTYETGIHPFSRMIVRTAEPVRNAVLRGIRKIQKGRLTRRNVRR